jgi:chromosome segregation ATPase
MSEDLTNKLPVNQEQKLSRVLEAVQGLTVRVDSMERKMEERLYDTRPIWEHLASKVDLLQEGLQELRQGQKDLREELRKGQDDLSEELRQGQNDLHEELRKGQDDLRQEFRGLKTYLRDILRRMSIFNDTLVAIQADYRDIYDRVRGLELKSEVNGQCEL